MGPFPSVMTNADMTRFCPGITAKTELVLISNPATGDDDSRMYARDGKDWVLLDDGGAALESPAPGAAPLSGEVVPEGLSRGDDFSVSPGGPPAVYTPDQRSQTDATSR
jgi:hypothetical protein